MASWVKGESGNPYGRRPPVNVFKELCQAYSTDVFRILWGIFENPNSHPAVRFQIGKFLQEQGYGRAPLALEVKAVQDITPSMMTTEQLKLAAAGQTQELVCNLIASGKLDEYAKMVNAPDSHVELLENLSCEKDVIDSQEEKPVGKVKPGKGKKAQG